MHGRAAVRLPLALRCLLAESAAAALLTACRLAEAQPHILAVCCTPKPDMNNYCRVFKTCSSWMSKDIEDQRFTLCAADGLLRAVGSVQNIQQRFRCMCSCRCTAQCGRSRRCWRRCAAVPLRLQVILRFLRCLRWNEMRPFRDPSCMLRPMHEAAWHIAMPALWGCQMPYSLVSQWRSNAKSNTWLQFAGAYAASVGEFAVAAQHFHRAAEAAPDTAARRMAIIQVHLMLLLDAM